MKQVINSKKRKVKTIKVLKFPKLNDFQKGVIVQARLNGVTIKQLATDMKISTKTVNKWWKQYNEGGNLGRKEGSGRPRKTTEADDKHILLSVKRNRRISIKEIKENCNLNGVCDNTISSRIKESGEYNSYWLGKKPWINKKNRRLRMLWAWKHRKWTTQEWDKVIWSDESPFVLRFNGRQRCWRRANEASHPQCMKGTVKHDKKINVWGCFASHGVGRLFKINGIMEKNQYHSILVHQMKPSAAQLFPDKNYIFQQDNDPKHTATINKDYVKNQKIKTFQWPSQSPDLNPIENLWSILDYSIRKRVCSNELELMEALRIGWEALPQHLLQALVHSMQRRCYAVIKAQGYPTKY